MTTGQSGDAVPAGVLAPLLEHVTIPACSDCRAFQRLLERVLPDYPEVEAREIAAETPRGMAITVERGVLRFPVIVLDDEIIGIEAIAESELRAALDARRARR